MKKIILKSLTLTNFKGTRSLTIQFGDFITSIFGANQAGKTTVMDAFLWLFFNKDSTGRQDFEIKTLDEQNKPYRKLDHEVSAIIEVDGDQVMIRKSLKEKWVKKQGETVPEFNGHTTSYFWDEVPLKLNEFEAKVSSIVKESIFKLITNAWYFNSRPWQERRSILEDIGGQMTDKQILQEMVAGGRTEYEALLAALTGTKTVDEYKRTIASKKKLIEDELLQFPIRINEANRHLPDQLDYAAISDLHSKATEDLAAVEGLLMNKTSAQKQQQQIITDKLTEVQKLKHERMQLEFDIKNSNRDKKQERQQAITDIQRKINGVTSDINRLTTEYATEEKRIEGLKELKAQLGNKWDSINQETLTFDDNSFCCPTCNRPYDETNVTAKKQEMINNFNTNKAARLKEVEEKGVAAAGDIKTGEANLGNIKANGTTKRAEEQQLQENLRILQQEDNRLNANEENYIADTIKNDPQIIALDEKVRNLNSEIEQPGSADDNSALLKQKNDLTQQIRDYNNQLKTKDTRDDILARIKELEGREKEMAAELASFEGIEYSILQFSKEKMAALETRINNRFELVKFKMFEEQINGAEVPCCETLINGVPYSDANTASKINAGLDIINTLSRHYGILAPVFVDNAESVNTLKPIASQMIRLVVSEDKTLRVETN